MNELINKYKKELDLLLKTKTTWEVFNDNKYINQYVSLDERNLYYVKSQNNGASFRILEGNTPISHFKLLQMPGCCGICISTKASVSFGYRQKGVNLLLNNFRIEIARNLGYGILLCTDVKSNTAQLNTLNKNNWKHIHEFRNPRTGNVLNISIKEL